MNEPWAHLITVDEVIRHHQRGIAKYGGDVRSVPRVGCLEGALGNAWSAELYREDEGKVEGWTFAAHLYLYLDTRQCFLDGNKRVAWLSMSSVLYKTGIRLEVSQERAVTMCYAIARREAGVGDLLRWFQETAVDIDEDQPSRTERRA